MKNTTHWLDNSYALKGPEPRSVSINLRLSTESAAIITRLAQEQGVTRQDVIIRMLDESLNPTAESAEDARYNLTEEKS